MEFRRDTIFFVTDNASYISHALCDLGGFNWPGFMGHNINLMMQDGLQEPSVAKIIAVCKSIVKFMKEKIARLEQFWMIMQLY